MRSLHATTALTLLLALLAPVGCGGDDDPNPSQGGAGGQEPVAGGGGQGGVAYDPLGLDACEAPTAVLPDPVTITAQTWGAPDNHAAACALRALEAPLAQADVICLGENSHGVSESTLWYTHTARFLVHRLGVRTIAMELTRASASAWTDFLRSADPADLARGFEDAQGSLGNSVETERWVLALAAVQAELPEGETITLSGFDVAVQPKLTRQAVFDYLAIVEPGEVAMWTEDLPPATGSTDFAAAGDAAEALHQQLLQNEASYVAASSPESHADALADAENLRDGYRFLEFYVLGDFWTGNATFREPGMIRNIERLRAALPADQPLLLTAHNMHCAKNHIIGDTVDGEPSPAFGTHLAETQGEGYATIAQLYQEGSHLVQTNTIAAQDFQAAPSMLEAALGDAVAADGILVGTSGANPVPFGDSWVMMNQPAGIVAERFDHILWLRNVSATTLR